MLLCEMYYELREMKFKLREMSFELHEVNFIHRVNKWALFSAIVSLSS